MSPRVTRSSARKSADSSLSASIDTSTTDPLDPEPQPPRSSKKRKVSEAVEPSSAPNRKRSKAHTPTMPSSPGEEGSPPGTAGSSKRKSGKSKKSTSPGETSTSKSRSKSSTSSKKRAATAKKETDDPSDQPTSPDSIGMSNNSKEDSADEPPGPSGEDAAFGSALSGALGGRGFGAQGLRSALGAMGGLGPFGAMGQYMEENMGRMREMLNTLKQKDDPVQQYLALQQISETLLMSNEDMLSGHFNSDAYAKEFVKIAKMSPADDDYPIQLTAAEDPEMPSKMRLLACRCIANLIEALPSATAAVVYNGAVPVLISKLTLSDEFDIELAEQALTTLGKISYEFPSSIVREDGLNALLQNIDFFTSSVQRTAVQTAAYCCRSIPEDSFAAIKEVMPKLRDVLKGSDQKVVEHGSLCITRIVDSFKRDSEKLEQLMDADLLGVILRLLLPGSTNIVSQSIHTQFLRVLSATARASPSLTKELFKMDVTDTLYQILTGVSPPSQDDENVASNIDSVVVMQALIHRPRDQILETLVVVCELLPEIDTARLGDLYKIADGQNLVSQAPSSRSTKPEERRRLLGDCKKELKRFAMILFPTLTDAYSSTVNLHVRRHVLDAQLKMLSNLDSDILEEALRPVPYASYLASILSQQDHPTLMVAGLQAAELLLQRLGRVYRYQFYREGVIAEVRKLANRDLIEKSTPADEKARDPPESASPVEVTETHDDESPSGEPTSIDEDSDQNDGDGEDENHDDDEDDDDEVIAEEIDMGGDDDDDHSSEDSDHEPPAPSVPSVDTTQDIITKCARKFIAQYETQEGAELRSKASQMLDDLNSLVQNISDCYANGEVEEGARLFRELAKSFEGNALESITSYELLSSQVLHTLVEVFDAAKGQANLEARAAFIEAFMGATTAGNIKTGSSASPGTPFSILVQKLQDLLSRAEHFEVVTVNSNSHDTNRGSPASALSKQIRIKLSAEGEESGIPASFRTIMVSIHAIATLKSLEDYLRPRIAIGDRPPPSRPRLAGTGLSDIMRNAPPELTGRRLASTPNPATSTAPPEAPSSSTRSSSARRAPKPPKSPADPGATTATAGVSTDSTPQPRRSTRKTRSQPAQPSTPPSGDSPARGETSESQNTLECADEAHLTDDDDDEDDDLARGQALLDELTEGLGDSPPEQDPSAVNVDVTPGGGVTTREDNSTPGTPSTRGLSQLDPSALLRRGGMPPSLARTMLASRGLAARSGMSYAGAVQSTPTDWHMEFSVNGKSIPADTTIYKAVHTNPSNSDEVSSRNVWLNAHTIQFKKVNGPPPAPETLASRPATPSEGSSGLPESLEQNPVTAVILRLLRILHEINGTVDELLGEKRKSSNVQNEPLTQFVNTKLTAKMNRQLEEPLIVASRSLPSWSEDLARLYPFLFPFETRHLFLQSTSFGYSRSMTRWINAQDQNESRHRHRDDRPIMGRLARQKVRIQRHRFLDSAVKVMESYGSNTSILEVEYFDEVGTGLGPTLEFYSSASKEFSRKKLKLWRENETASNTEFAYGKHGLFPMPMSEEQVKSSHGEKVLKLFGALGKFVARSMLDSRLIDVSFNPMFFRWEAGQKAQLHTIGTLKSVDESLANSLMMLKQFDQSKKKIEEQKRLTPEQKRAKMSGIRVANATMEDMSLEFTLPGYNIELVPNGKNTEVTIDNVGEYIDKVIDMTVGSGVKAQIESFRKGFSEVFPYAALRAFTPDELSMLFGHADEDWSMEMLADSIKADHGYNLDSKSVQNLLQTMAEFTMQQRREFLQFVTGSPKLPIGGFKSLTPMFTVVLRPSDPGHHPDEYLPSCMTCVNYLKLPNYSDLDTMKLKIGVAIKEGQGAFHLS